MTYHSPQSSVVLTNISRRGVLKGLAAGGLVLAAQLPSGALAEYKTGAADMPNGVVSDPHVFISIAPNGTVSIVAARAEMGTGAARTTLPMIVAEELEADWSRVRVVQSPGDEKTYGNQDTDGSRSVRHFIQPMRQCGAAARRMLEQAASTRWGVPLAEVEAKFHEVVHTSSGRKLGYGELTAEAAQLPVPPAGEIKLKDASALRYMGTGKVAIVDLNDITIGKAIYGQDVTLPGMKFAVVARPPVVGGRVTSYDASNALAVSGVAKVVEIKGTPAPAKFAPLGGVAVIADTTWAALKGRNALKITWDDGPNRTYDSDTYRTFLEEQVRKPGKVAREAGDVDRALASAARVITAEYYAPHLAHATMEPPAAVARMVSGATPAKWEVWAPVQSPGGARIDVAAALGVAPEDVTLHTTLLGGAFGRKSKCDFAIEAALLSRELGGAPVKVVWTREDDIRHGFYHTVSVDRLEAGIDADGKLTAWRQRSAAPTIMSTFMQDPKYPAAFELGLGLTDLPFDLSNIRLESAEAPSHVRIGWFRSVNNVPNAFAIQSFVSELAHALGRDPKDFLLELIGPPRKIQYSKLGPDFWNYGEPEESFPIDTGRLRGVIELAAERAGWGRPMPKGRGLGLAAHRSFLTYVATVVEVQVDDAGSIRVPRVETAVDCGFAVNPERIRSQIEGCAVMGLTLAKYGAITCKAGRVEQGNFDDYKLVRIDERPRVTNVHIVPHGVEVPAAGIGEPGLPPFAPALCNAIFAATGKRIRSLPIGNQLA
jgi:isoquinoline 1-oxidoreductase beta subunit